LRVARSLVQFGGRVSGRRRRRRRGLDCLSDILVDVAVASAFQLQTLHYIPRFYLDRNYLISPTHPLHIAKSAPSSRSRSISRYSYQISAVSTTAPNNSQQQLQQQLPTTPSKNQHLRKRKKKMQPGRREFNIVVLGAGMG